MHRSIYSPVFSYIAVASSLSPEFRPAGEEAWQSLAPALELPNAVARATCDGIGMLIGQISKQNRWIDGWRFICMLDDAMS